MSPVVNEFGNGDRLSKAKVMKKKAMCEGINKYLFLKRLTKQNVQLM